MKKLGDCYEAAARFIISQRNDKGWSLVHGDVTGQGPIAGVRHGHAWLERGGTVLDVSNGRFLEMSRERYYRIGKIDPAQVVRYSRTEATDKLLDTMNYGPWSNTADFIYSKA